MCTCVLIYTTTVITIHACTYRLKKNEVGTFNCDGIVPTAMAVTVMVVTTITIVTTMMVGCDNCYSSDHWDS